MSMWLFLKFLLISHQMKLKLYVHECKNNNCHLQEQQCRSLDLPVLKGGSRFFFSSQMDKWESNLKFPVCVNQAV